MAGVPTTYATASILSRTLYSDATISRPSLVSDGGSGTTETLTAVATVKAHLQERREPREMESAVRQALDYDHVLYVLKPCDVRRGDYVTIASEAGVRYRVVEPTEPSHANFMLAVMLRREVA
jgi:SPP1 family predicted phage head-tail adaptor